MVINPVSACHLKGLQGMEVLAGVVVVVVMKDAVGHASEDWAL